MGKDFELDDEITVDASPEAVWDAIATGPGIDSWFMGRNQVTPGEGGSVRTEFGDYTPQGTITGWQPGGRLAYGEDPDPDGRRVGYEFLIEGRTGAATVVRLVTSGFLPGDDWSDEFEAMGNGLRMFLRTLREYLTHFPARTATPVTAFAPPTGDWHRDWAVLHDALGLTVPARTGQSVSIPRIDGTVYYTNPDTIGIRTTDALYRFLGGNVGPINASHHIFADIDPDHAETEWTTWLRGVLS